MWWTAQHTSAVQGRAWWIAWKSWRASSILPRRLPLEAVFGKLFADKGYITTPLAECPFLHQGLRLITKLRVNMRNRLLAFFLEFSDHLLLRKRALTETIVDLLKNVCQVEHSRYGCPVTFLAHLLAGLIAYCHQPKRPSQRLDLLRLIAV